MWFLYDLTQMPEQSVCSHPLQITTTVKEQKSTTNLFFWSLHFIHWKHVELYLFPSQGCNAAECPSHPEDAGTGPQDEVPADLRSYLYSLRQLWPRAHWGNHLPSTRRLLQTHWLSGVSSAGLLSLLTAVNKKSGDRFCFVNGIFIIQYHVIMVKVF